MIPAALNIEVERVIQIDVNHHITAQRMRDVAAQTVVLDCWLFTGYQTESGYGRIEFVEQQIYTHRASFACVNGIIPDGINICHHCDVPNCIRPDHLFAGTVADNVADMDRKGRRKVVPWPRGEANYLATLTDRQVAEIRTHPPLSQRKLAEKFNVSQSTVWRILNGKVRG